MTAQGSTPAWYIDVPVLGQTHVTPLTDIRNFSPSRQADLLRTRAAMAVIVLANRAVSGVTRLDRLTRRDPNHRDRRDAMPKIKHIALSTQDVDKTAKFYIDVFGMKEIAKIDGPGARGYYLSDGDINLAILNFKNDAVAGVERGTGWSGIHHIGFQVESLEAIAERPEVGRLRTARRHQPGARRGPRHRIGPPTSR